jgi:hypothetical protein
MNIIFRNAPYQKKLFSLIAQHMGVKKAQKQNIIDNTKN